MAKQLPKTYNPKKVEDRIYSFWEKTGFFNPDKLPKRHKKPYIIMMAPPNVTGSIHIGHALENTLSDLLIRYQRMQGRKTLFLPGKDHAGIAAQYVVERSLKKEGKTRFDLGREKFIQRMWQWMEKQGVEIETQIKKLGISCDWSRKRFTMDRGYQEAIKRAFFHYYKKEWIYQGSRIINWCPGCETSLSDLELEHKEKKGKLWYIRYPLKKCKMQNAKIKMKIQNAKRIKSSELQYIVVATTRPETMLGDTGVAVNPKDKRYKDLIGQKAILPIQNKEIPIVADKAIDMDFGTGALKVTPAHDITDWEIGLCHKLRAVKVIDEKGKMTKESKICEGLAPLECRERVIKELKKEGLLEKIENYTHSLPYCYRCHNLIEPLISQQWFLKMENLAKMAMRAAKKGKLKFIPKNFEKIYFAWLNNIQDWCISRQIWWGHKIPLKGETDVLDTWFSSALWPFATLGWPFACAQNQKSKIKNQKYCSPKKGSDLFNFYPTNLISSAREIFYLWIVRMVFSGLEFTGEAPFQVIYTHPTVLDKQGRKMSKSLGNVVDPLALIERYGTDATRFGLAWQTTGLQDMRFDEGTMLTGKKFCNKIWNASRFVLQQSGNPKSAVAEGDSPKGCIRNPKQIQNPKSKIQNLTVADKKILGALEKTIKSVNKDLEDFRFGQALQTLYHFFWHDFCDVYLEKSKKQIQDTRYKIQTTEILLYVLLTSLKLLHPFMPFITEEIYQKLLLEDKKKSLMVEEWPKS